MEGSYITFENFKIEEGKIDFECNDKVNGRERSFKLYFHFNKPILPSNDAIVCALSTLFRRNYSKIYINLRMSSRILKNIENSNKVEITCNGITRNQRETRNGYSLNFSGGFDSLACIYLLPEDTKLMSVDYDSKAINGREYEFFSLFNEVNIVKTNVRKFFRVSSLMNSISSLLYSNTHGIKTQFSGNVLCSGPNGFMKMDKEVAKVRAPNGIEHIQLTYGLTQVATTIIACHYAPEYISKSLDSCADVGSEKYYRKQLLVRLASQKLGKNIKIDSDKPQEKILSWGDINVGVDFIGIYFLKKFGIDFINATHMVNIPNEIIEITNTLSLSFYERYNTNRLYEIPKDIRGYFLSRLSDAGIIPYTEKDWKEFRIIANCLAKYYPGIYPS